MILTRVPSIRALKFIEKFRVGSSGWKEQHIICVFAAAARQHHYVLPTIENVENYHILHHPSYKYFLLSVMINARAIRVRNTANISA